MFTDTKDIVSYPHADHYATRAIHIGSEPDPTTGAVIPSLSVATTFKQTGVGKHKVSDSLRVLNNRAMNTLGHRILHDQL
jgi:cystathionine beta-lyase/cystathionine gamma-synthase